MTDDRIKILYMGPKKDLTLNLDYLEEKNLRFSDPDKSVMMLKHDAARLIKENPRSFRVGIASDNVAKPKKQAAKKEISKRIDTSEVTAFLSSFPSPEAVADYCKSEYGMTLDPTLEMEELVEQAAGEISERMLTIG